MVFNFHFRLKCPDDVQFDTMQASSQILSFGQVSLKFEQANVAAKQARDIE